MIVGLLSLLAKQRELILNEIDKSLNRQPSQLKYINRLSEIPKAGEPSVKWHYFDAHGGMAGFSKDLVSDYYDSREFDHFTEETSIKAQLRRLRNFYVVLMEVCQRDKRLLAW